MRRFFAAIAILWFIGFAWFTIALPRPYDGGISQAVIVPTGAAGRIEHGLEVLANGDAREMLVTGVDREVRPAEFAAQFGVSMELMQCCITLGYKAVDTRGNAAETAEWIEDRGITDLRLVTTDWHMRRARNELEHSIPAGVTIIGDAVESEPSLRILFLEYHKYIASRVANIWRE
ncbi:MAG: YdcF family protein [Pontixanthobacter sp.]